MVGVPFVAPCQGQYCTGAHRRTGTPWRTGAGIPGAPVGPPGASVPIRRTGTDTGRTVVPAVPACGYWSEPADCAAVFAPGALDVWSVPHHWHVSGSRMRRIRRQPATGALSPLCPALLGPRPQACAIAGPLQDGLREAPHSAYCAVDALPAGDAHQPPPRTMTGSPNVDRVVNITRVPRGSGHAAGLLLSSPSAREQHGLNTRVAGLVDVDGHNPPKAGNHRSFRRMPDCSNP